MTTAQCPTAHERWLRAALRVALPIAALQLCQCAAEGVWTRTLHLTQRPVAAAPTELRSLAHAVTAACSDTTDSASMVAIWSALGGAADNDTAGAATQSNLRAFERLVLEGGCTLFELRPPTLEAMRAVSALRALAVLVCVDYPPGAPPAIPSDVRSAPQECLARNAGHVRIRCIEELGTRGNGYLAECADGERFEGLAEDLCTGVAYPALSGDGAETYHQVVRVLWVSPLPATAVAAHVDEWYSSMTFTHTRPDIVPVR